MSTGGPVQQQLVLGEGKFYNWTIERFSGSIRKNYTLFLLESPVFDVFNIPFVLTLRKGFAPDAFLVSLVEKQQHRLQAPDGETLVASIILINGTCSRLSHLPTFICELDERFVSPRVWTFTDLKPGPNDSVTFGLSLKRECKSPPHKDQHTQTDFEPESTPFTSADEAVNILECQVCRALMEPPILMCATGHSICHQCKQILKKCALCKSDFLEGVRNFTLESLTDYVYYPCPADGCAAKYVPQRKDTHRREECLHREIECFACEWSGEMISYKDHALHHHLKHIQHIKYGTFYTDSTRWRSLPRNPADILVAPDALFMLRYKVGTDREVCLCIFQFGTSVSAANYRFTVKLESLDKSIDFSAQSTHAVHCDLDQPDRECVILGTERALRRQGLITPEGKLKLQYRITKAD